jgi:DNA-binding MarR family transcriptional regulator
VNAGDLHRLARLLRELALTATADPGERRVSPGHLAIVEDVSHNDETSIGEIARRTGLAQSLVSNVVAQLRDAGVFATRADPADRRRVLVKIREAMRRDVFASRGARPIDAAIRTTLPDASEGDVAQIVRLLDELAERLRA